MKESGWAMRVFMLGWEFPPFISGGLGTACYGLTKAMSGLGTDNHVRAPAPSLDSFFDPCAPGESPRGLAAGNAEHGISAG